MLGALLPVRGAAPAEILFVNGSKFKPTAWLDERMQARGKVRGFRILRDRYFQDDALSRRQSCQQASRGGPYRGPAVPRRHQARRCLRAQGLRRRADTSTFRSMALIRSRGRPSREPPTTFGQDQRQPLHVSLECSLVSQSNIGAAARPRTAYDIDGHRHRPSRRTAIRGRLDRRQIEARFEAAAARVAEDSCFFARHAIAIASAVSSADLGGLWTGPRSGAVLGESRPRRRRATRACRSCTGRDPRHMVEARIREIRAQVDGRCRCILSARARPRPCSTWRDLVSRPRCAEHVSSRAKPLTIKQFMTTSTAVIVGGCRDYRRRCT